MKQTNEKPEAVSTRTVVIISCILLGLAVFSIIAILLPVSADDGYIAEIYQDGALLDSINLAQVQETYRFTVTGENNCTNEIEVRPGSIAIITADCPDKLCVHQGFISDTRLPITCLPNKLVIVLRSAAEPGASPQESLDIITY